MREWLTALSFGVVIALVLFAWIFRLDQIVNNRDTTPACDPKTLWCGAPPR
jgi:hypothetical protein